VTGIEAATVEPRSGAVTFVVDGLQPANPACGSLGIADWAWRFQAALNAECAALGLPVSRADRKRALAVLPGGAR
jgi:hypothetical protein